MRLRQVCLVADNLEQTLDRLCRLLRTDIVYRDPGVAHFGLANGLLQSGGDFIEVVSPLPGHNDTAGGRHLARRGDSFYMVIFQCADAAPISRHISRQQVRPVWTHEDDKISATHFHPVDFGGAIVSVDSMGRDDWQSPNAFWEWTKWPPATPPDYAATATGAIAGVTMSAADPQALARHWGGLLQRPVHANQVQFDGASIAFVDADTPTPYVSGVQLRPAAETPDTILARAADMGLPVTNGAVHLCGVNWSFGNH